MLPEFPGEYRARRRDWLIPGTMICTTWYGLRSWYEKNKQ